MQEIEENKEEDIENVQPKNEITNQNENAQSNVNSNEDNKEDESKSDNSNESRSLSFINPELLQQIQNTISLQNILLDINEIEIEESIRTIESLEFFSTDHNFSILIRNIAFMSIFRPLYIIQYAKFIKQILTKLESKEGTRQDETTTNDHHIDYHTITLKELFHYIFISDEVNCFNSFLHLTFHLYNQQVYTSTEIVSRIGNYFKKYILSRGPITSLFIMFAPEIDAIDHETYEKMYQFIQTWVTDNVFNPTTISFIKKFDYYKENGYKKLREMRNELSCQFEFFEIFINDDVERLRVLSANPEFEIDKKIESPFLSPFYFLTNEYSLLSCAASFGSVECFKYLIQNGANYNNPQKETQVSQYAMIGGSIEIIRICEQFNMNFEGTLQSSATFFRNDIFEYLHETKNQNLLEVSPTKAIVILQAATSNNFELMLSCLEMNCDVNQKDEYEMNCVKKASYFGLSQMMELLLSIPEIEVNQGELNFAVSNGHFDTAKLIIEKCKNKGIDYNLNFVGITGKPPIFDAVIHSHLNCVDLIYKNGGDLNFVTNEKYTISHFLASQNDITIFEYLSNKINFDINLKTRMFFSPLILAVVNMAVDMLDFLLDSYHKDVEQLNLLLSMKLAVFKGNSYVVRPFLKFEEYRDFIFQVITQSDNLELTKLIDSYKNK